MKTLIEKQKEALARRRKELTLWEAELKVPEEKRMASIIAPQGSKSDGSDKATKRKIAAAKKDIANLEAKLK